MSSVEEQVFAYKIGEGVPVLSLPARVNPDTLDELERQSQTAGDGKPRIVVVDLLAVEAISLTMQARLCQVLRRLAGRHPLSVIVADPRLRWIIEVCRIDGVRCELTVAAVARRAGSADGRSQATAGPGS